MTVPTPLPRVAKTSTMNAEDEARAAVERLKTVSLREQADPKAQAGAADTKERDSYTVTAIADITDRSLHATIARFTNGLSPAALAHAYLDWATHLAYAPGKQLQLVDKAIRKSLRLMNYACRCAFEPGKA